jgi:hypothetical protein
MPALKYLTLIFLFFCLCGPVFPHKIVLYLANLRLQSSNDELSQSLAALHTVFLSKHQAYPVFVAYDSRDRAYLTPALRQSLAQQAHATEIPYNEQAGSSRGTICFVVVSGFHRIPWPSSMYTDVYTDDNPYYARLGYRLMCRFWAHRVFSQPFMLNVTAYLRLDTDTFLVDMPADPFRIMDHENIGYMAPSMYREDPRTTAGLWETFLRFARDEQIHPGGLIPLSMEHQDMYSPQDIWNMAVDEAIDVLYQREYNLAYYYNNWEASRVDLWTSPVYQRLARHIDSAGGIFLKRWGDAPIRTLALHLLRDELASQRNTSLDPSLFRQYHGLSVYHKILHRTAGAEL